MDKTYRTEFSRLFLVETLPSPLTPASSHIQIFDNYIANTRMRLRSVRVPETKEWTRSLQQRFPLNVGKITTWKIADMHLNDAEYAQFQIFEGDEIRKNRYFHEFDARMFAFDIYLGGLRGLNRARVDFQNESEMADFLPPPFTIFEVTSDPFFDDANLVHHKFEDMQRALVHHFPEVTRSAASDE